MSGPGLPVGLDAAFNNAGTATGGPIEAAREAEWDRVIDTNVKSAYFCLKAEAEQMKRQGGGAIVFNGSVLAGIGLPGTSIYSASKGAITALTRAATVELGPFHIRVNSVNPSLTRTPLTTRLISTAEDGTEVSPLAPAGSIPLGRFGRTGRNGAGRAVPAVRPGVLRQRSRPGRRWGTKRALARHRSDTGVQGSQNTGRAPARTWMPASRRLSCSQTASSRR